MSFKRNWKRRLIFFFFFFLCTFVSGMTDRSHFLKENRDFLCFMSELFLLFSYSIGENVVRREKLSKPWKMLLCGN